jgi:hypothetical protein
MVSAMLWCKSTGELGSVNGSAEFGDLISGVVSIFAALGGNRDQGIMDICARRGSSSSPKLEGMRKKYQSARLAVVLSSDRDNCANLSEVIILVGLSGNKTYDSVQKGGSFRHNTAPITARATPPTVSPWFAETSFTFFK